MNYIPYQNILKHEIGIQCCNEFVDLIFKPEGHKKNASCGLVCRICGKENRIEFTKQMILDCEDPVLVESIKILKQKWNEK